jgi:hypothetical protein
LTTDVEVVEKTIPDTGVKFIRARFYLKTHPDLHSKDVDNDDDRTAVTFWATSREQLENLFMKAVGELGRPK